MCVGGGCLVAWLLGCFRWAAILGKLAVQYPQLKALNIDDFSSNLACVRHLQLLSFFPPFFLEPVPTLSQNYATPHVLRNVLCQLHMPMGC